MQSLRKEMNEILVGSEEGEPAVKKARVETPEPDTGKVGCVGSC